MFFSHKTYHFLGEGEKFKASELDRHGPSVRGWQSCRDCAYPQELILRLHKTATLHQVQILAHQYLIRKQNDCLFNTV